LRWASGAASRPLEASLDWAANIAADDSEDWDLRLSAANTLLDFPRVRHRALLENLAARQSGWGVQFSMDDVRDAFSGRDATPQSRHGFADPWKFYAPRAIARRQQRWAEEDAKHLAREAFNDTPASYVRATPKVGRNDPCPCGSGKKYKKCWPQSRRARAISAAEKQADWSKPSQIAERVPEKAPQLLKNPYKGGKLLHRRREELYDRATS
jgi:hypothetical protein